MACAERAGRRSEEGKVLYRLCYCSRNLIPPERFVAEIGAMLLGARKHNIIHDLTGILMFSADCFIQTLEGPEATLLRLFERIRRDKRHCDVVVLEEGSLRRRAYADWSMAFGAGADAIDSLAGIEINQTFDPEDPHAEARMLRHVENYATQATRR